MLKQCANAVSQSPDSTDQNYEVKFGYEATIRDATNDILREMERLAPATDDMAKKFNSVVKKAAAFWLKVGQQRYRLFLVFSVSGAEPVRSGRSVGQAGNGLQRVVVSPELRRRGNAQGDRLDSDEMVLNCNGDFRALSFR